MSDDGWVDASDVEIKVDNGDVTLTGSVPDRFSKRRAEDIAESVSGVRNVENRIRVTQQDLPQAAMNRTDNTDGTESRGSAYSNGKGSTRPAL